MFLILHLLGGGEWLTGFLMTCCVLVGVVGVLGVLVVYCTCCVDINIVVILFGMVI